MQQTNMTKEAAPKVTPELIPNTDRVLEVDVRNHLSPDMTVDVRSDPFRPFMDLPVDDSIKETVNRLYETIPQLQEGLRLIQEYDPATKQHVTNTGLVFAELAEATVLDQDHKDLGIVAAMLHDIGKLDVDQETVAPTDAEKSVITDRDNDPRWLRLKQHPELGFVRVAEMFAEEPDGSIMKKLVPLVILTHHCHNHSQEHYPSQDVFQSLADRGLLNLEDLKDPTLIEIAKILAISDVYEAITAKRVYQKGRGFEDPARVEAVLRESHPDMPDQIDMLMSFHKLRRFPPDGFMPVAAPQEQQSSQELAGTKQ